MTGETICARHDAILATPWIGREPNAPRVSVPSSELDPALSAEQLAERSKTGCRDSFEQLVAQFEARVFNFLLQMTRNRQDAEDLTQETFVKAFRAIHRFDPRHRFASWLYTIAKRTAVNHFRSVKPTEPASDKHELDHADPASLLAAKEQKHSLWQLARTLKPGQFEALWLRYGEDFSVAETAQIMNRTQIHVKVLLHRGRNRLAELLEKRRPDLRSQGVASGGQSD
jgi:RNA polymerase sigma-70 factor (ECF subfamily)